MEVEGGSGDVCGKREKPLLMKDVDEKREEKKSDSADVAHNKNTTHTQRQKERENKRDERGGREREGEGEGSVQRWRREVKEKAFSALALAVFFADDAHTDLDTDIE